MALYSCNVINIKRGEGFSSVGKAAYYSCSKLVDPRTGNTYNHSRRKSLSCSEIIAPEYAPDWVKDREQLWGINELSNKRKDARVGKAIIIALPRELEPDEQPHLIRKFVADKLTPQQKTIPNSNWQKLRKTIILQVG